MEDYVSKNLTMENTSQFDWTDYLLLTLITTIPLPIAIYYGIIDRQKNNICEYFLSGKNFNVFPIAFSLAASYISSLVITGIPAEVYLNGSLIWLTIPSTILACIFSYHFFLPIFYELNISSAYIYLELRFNNAVRSAISIIFIMTNILILPTFIHAPSLILSEATGIRLAVIATCIMLICLLYAINGFKSVVWTSFIQTVLILIICFVIITIGTIYSGGISFVFRNAFNDGKLNIFKMNPNPFVSESFWTVTIGTFFIWASGLVSSQVSLQKLLALKSIKQAKIALVIFLTVLTFVLSLCVYAGLVLYSSFYGCDPIENQMLTRLDQIFPYFVQTKIGHLPTVSGIFMAGIVLASIGTFTNSLNAIAFTIHEDFLKNKYKSETTTRFVMLWIMIIIVVYTFFMVIFNDLNKLSMIIPFIEVAASSISLVFIMGMMIPIINTIGATFGIVSNIILLLWLSIGSIVKQINFYDINVYSNKTDICPGIKYDFLNQMEAMTNYNETIYIDDSDAFTIYKLSHMLYLPLGIIIGIIVAVIVSYITGKTDLSLLNHQLISPPIRRYLPKKYNVNVPEDEFMLNTIVRRSFT